MISLIETKSIDEIFGRTTIVSARGTLGVILECKSRRVTDEECLESFNHLPKQKQDAALLIRFATDAKGKASVEKEQIVKGDITLRQYFALLRPQLRNALKVKKGEQFQIDDSLVPTYGSTESHSKAGLITVLTHLVQQKRGKSSLINKNSFPRASAVLSKAVLGKKTELTVKESRFL